MITSYAGDIVTQSSRRLRDDSKVQMLETETTYLVHEAHVILLISFRSFKGFPPGTVNTKRS